MKRSFGKFALYCTLFLLPVSLAIAKYKIKDLQVRPAGEYPAHQDFQNLVIGAYACDTEEKAESLFDTDKLTEKGFLPILIVVENSNNFPVRLSEEYIFLMEETGRRLKSVHFIDVLLEMELKKRRSNYPPDKEKLAREVVDREMFIDFEHKAFGDRTIPPSSSDQGIVFYKPLEQRKLSDYHIYIPEIWNSAEGEPLVFFEFQLQ